MPKDNEKKKALSDKRIENVLFRHSDCPYITCYKEEDVKEKIKEYLNWDIKHRMATVTERLEKQEEIFGERLI